jgi:hypothetical protein
VPAVPKPQSVPASTFSWPTSSATRHRRWAISSGCSMKLDTESITPGINALPAGSLTLAKTSHSCSWRGLAAS